jgi:hypothetical protein
MVPEQLPARFNRKHTHFGHLFSGRYKRWAATWGRFLLERKRFVERFLTALVTAELVSGKFKDAGRRHLAALGSQPGSDFGFVIAVRSKNGSFYDGTAARNR